jgi:hypothetical protein
MDASAESYRNDGWAPLTFGAEVRLQLQGSDEKGQCPV